MKRLSGKKAVVTGGTRGIGRAIALRYAEEGASVVILGTHEERGAEAIALLEEKRENPAQFFEFRKVDVSKHAEVMAFADEFLKLFGDIDILVNCAGITRDGLLMRMKEEDWDLVLETNLKSVYNTTHAFLRSMTKKRYGKIINITSVIGIMGNPGQTNYAASKAGMIGMTKSLAKEVASRNISVNCIAPGFIDTDMTGKLTPEQKEMILQQVPMKRLGEGKEIAHAALFLASSDSDYITGQVLTVDGGMTA
jgi:3-oxoacyl-[acyl-carrier protein] reductase